MRIGFKVDASQELGGGHVYRCLALAEELADRGALCTFFTRKASLEIVPALAGSGHRIVIYDGSGKDEAGEATAVGSQLGPVDLLIIDDYSLGATFEWDARTWAASVVAIDDAPWRTHAADIIIDHTHGRIPADYAKVAPRSMILAGSNYALLRRQFGQHRQASLRWRAARAGRLEHVLVAFGATDPHNYSEAALDALLQFPHVDIGILLGAAHPASAIRARIAEMSGKARLLESLDDVAELMARTDLAIGGAGGMSWERCAVGLPAVVVDDNQIGVAESLANVGAALCLGTGRDAIGARLSATVTMLRAQPARLLAMSGAAAKICDAQGATRVAKTLLRAARPDLEVKTDDSCHNA